MIDQELTDRQIEMIIKYYKALEDQNRRIRQEYEDALRTRKLHRFLIGEGDH